MGWFVIAKLPYTDCTHAWVFREIQKIVPDNQSRIFFFFFFKVCHAPYHGRAWFDKSHLLFSKSIAIPKIMKFVSPHYKLLFSLDHSIRFGSNNLFKSMNEFYKTGFSLFLFLYLFFPFSWIKKQEDILRHTN